MRRSLALFAVLALMIHAPMSSAQVPADAAHPAAGGPSAPSGPAHTRPDSLHLPPEPGSFPRTWISGTDCAQDPAIQVHAYNDDFLILRQSMCLNYEAPFMYLIFGEERAILFDTGANGNPPVASTVYREIDKWKLRNGVSDYQLVVAHTHGHGDHVANDDQFQGKPDTVVVSANLNAVKSAFDLPNWPDGASEFDLGGRTLDILPIPGHQSAHIMVYDARTQLMLSGDSFYPGFLFISNFNQYRESIAKLVAFAADHPVTWILGDHIEMTSTPGVAYPYGTSVQPDERALPLTLAMLHELDAALQAMRGNPHSEVHDDFIITP
ncbi:MAG: hypothetical protein DHS20C15_26980 [Planctomycetota bacterium]|nr:MAG: hypothetical protein DHS20C15_26980 [Planctomycetota bacterium]